MVVCGRGKNIDVHVAVALAFHGPRPFPKAEVLHLDHDETNNTPNNLRWGTRSENLKMDYARGLNRFKGGYAAA
jgi:HNH endonuclease